MPFPNQKKLYLQKQDKSRKGDIDEQVLPLLKIINAHDDYYTTSSCSGRVYLWQGSGKKNEVEWLRVSHELIDEEFFDIGFEGRALAGEGTTPFELAGNLRGRALSIRERCFDSGSSLQPGVAPSGVAAFRSHIPERADSASRSASALSEGSQYFSLPHADKSGLIWLRLEPFILHVACKDIAAANRLVELARKIYKKSCILTISNKIIVEIRGSEMIEMPLYDKGRLLFSGDIQWLVEMLNAKIRQINEGREKLLGVIFRNL